MNERRIRGVHILIGFTLITLIYIVRMFFLQVMSVEYAVAANSTDIRDEELIPARGILYDRNDQIYANISPIFGLEFIPSQITIPDTTVLTRYLGLSKDEIREQIKYFDNKGIQRVRWQELATKVDKHTFSKLSEHLWAFDGIKVISRPSREYTHPVGAHFLGFINEVDTNDLKYAKKTGDTTDYKYKQRDLIGRTGIERHYEKKLRGIKGKRTVLVDVFNREVGPYAGGKYDEYPVPGEDLQLGIDMDLQTLGEQLMQNKRGSIVAIEPVSGDILAFVSAPSYDPGLLVGKEAGLNHLRLQADTLLKPLINRPISAQYPPGSIFKILQALAAMSEGIATENTHFSCPGFWRRGPSNKPRCHGSHGHCSLHNGIKYSCNPFFAELYYTFMSHPKFKDTETAYKRWREIMSAYGIGGPLGVDIPDEKPGNIPEASYYNRLYNNNWSGLTIYSNAIGRGEILLTPLQMANVAAMIANRGWYIRPHFLRAERDQDGAWQKVPNEKITVPGKPEHYDVVIQAMEEVVKAGTARRANTKDIVVCGKTGTVENKIKGDHSVFMAFAPKENPKIAIAVVVENAGFGGTWAAPIASLMIEQYIKGAPTDERKLKRILEASFIELPEESESGAAEDQTAP